MSNENGLDTLDALLAAIPAEEVQPPTIPVKDLNQEAENLYSWAMQDKDALAGAGLAIATIEMLHPAATRLRIAEGAWNTVRFSRAETQQKWADESSRAYALRDKLLHDFLYAYRDRPDVLSRVRGVADGTGNADMIQDLANLQAIGNEFGEELDRINFDKTQLDLAGTVAEQMGLLLGAANADSAAENSARATRDRAYTFLKNILTKIRECGKYVFYRNEERLRGYASDYSRRHASASVKENNSDPKEEPVAG